MMKIKPTEMKYCLLASTLILLACSACVKTVNFDRPMPALDISDKILEIRNYHRAIEKSKNEAINIMLQQTLNEAIDAWQECQIALADSDTNHYRLKGVNWASLRSETTRHLFSGVENDGKFTSCEKKNDSQRIYRLATRHIPDITDLDAYGLRWYWTADKNLEFDKESGELILFKGSYDNKIFTVRWSDGKITTERIWHKHS